MCSVVQKSNLYKDLEETSADHMNPKRRQEEEKEKPSPESSEMLCTNNPPCFSLAFHVDGITTASPPEQLYPNPTFLRTLAPRSRHISA